MQVILKEAITNFSMEKQAQQEMADIIKENSHLKMELASYKEDLGRKESQIRELTIQVKELDISLNHTEAMLQREKQEKDNNAIAFKRILSTLTKDNKENSNN